MDFDTYYDRLATDPPAIWSLGWIADYPGRNDFLGVLLSSEFDQQLRRLVVRRVRCCRGRGERRRPTRPPRPRPTTEAEAIVASDAPVVPIGYGTGWALSRDGLLGASENGLGIVRMAGLAWAD